MKHLQIYLAGGMGKFGKDNYEVGNNWRVYCKDFLDKQDVDCIVKVINPNDYFNFLDKPKRYETEREVMDFDLRNLRQSDLIICNFNDMSSLGTMAEIATAYERRIPVIGLDEAYQNLHPWQKAMCERIFYSADEMLNYITEFYLM